MIFLRLLRNAAGKLKLGTAGRTANGSSLESEAAKQSIAAGSKSSATHSAAPGAEEVAALGQWFSQGRYADMESRARAATLRFPEHGEGWKALGVALLCQGKAAEAVVPLERAAALLPCDANVWCNLGIALHRQGRFAEAETSYRRALELVPDIAEVHGNLGNALNELGRFAEAEASCRRALTLTPNDARPHNALGFSLMEQGRLAEAEASYRRALELETNFAAAHHFLAIALRAQDRFDEAEASCRRALAHKPNFAAAYDILGSVLMDLRRPAEAEASYKRALDLNPNYVAAYNNLGNALRAQGKTAEARECYRRLVEIDPGDDVALHWFLALSGRSAERAPSKYVATVFDGYAKTFDAHLTGALNYRAPEQIVGLIRGIMRPRDENWDVLDLGCGTGLAGAAIAPNARQLVGVDLSAKMLDKARRRNVYSRLVNSDLLEMTRQEPSAGYDAITATDVFIYLGRLDDIVAQAKRLLRPAGVFAFSIEALDPLQTASQATVQDFQLLPTARFAHSSAYLSRLAAEHGFEIRHFSPTTIRIESGSPIAGWLVVWSV